MSSYAYNLSLYGQLNPGPGYGQTFAFNVSTSLTAAMDGGLITNEDAGAAVTFTFPPAVEGYTFAVRQVEDYPITMAPDGSDTILGETDDYTIHSGEIVVFVVQDTGDWQIVTGGAPNIISPTYNVRRYGAIGNGSADDTVAFQTALSKCTTRGSSVLVPETDDGALPGYYLTADPFESLGTISNTVPGTVMELGGRLLVNEQLVLPGGTRIIGMTSNNNNTLSGSMIRCTSAFPNDGTAIIRIGRPVGATGWAGATDEAADGSMIEWVTINGAGRTVVGSQVVGVYSTSMQERSGLKSCIIMNIHTGLLLGSGTGINPANFTIHGVDSWTHPLLTAVGFNCLAGGKFTLEKCTAVAQYSSGFSVTGTSNSGGLVRLTIAGTAEGTVGHPFVNGQRVTVGSVGGTTEANGTWLVANAAATTIDLAACPVASGGTGSNSAYANAWTSGGKVYANMYAGFRISGSDIRAVNNHVERAEYLAEIGGANDFWTYSILSDNTHGYNNSTHPELLGAIRIRDTEDYMFDIDIKRTNVNSANGGAVMIEDERNKVRIPLAAFHANDLQLAEYKFGGSYEYGAAATPIPVETSWVNGRRAVSIAGGTTQNDYDKLRAKELFVTVTGAGDVTFTSFTNGFLGHGFWVVNEAVSVGNVILDHAAATGTAANRLESNTLADITLQPGQRAWVDYARGPTAYTAHTDVASRTGRWFIE